MSVNNLNLKALLVLLSLYALPAWGAKQSDCARLLISNELVLAAADIKFAEQWMSPVITKHPEVKMNPDFLQQLTTKLLQLKVSSSFALEQKAALEWQKLGGKPDFNDNYQRWMKLLDSKLPDPSTKASPQYLEATAELLQQVDLFLFIKPEHFLLPHLTEHDQRKVFGSGYVTAWSYDHLLNGSMTVAQRVTLASTTVGASYGFHSHWGIPPEFRSRDLTQVSEQWLQNAFVLPEINSVSTLFQLVQKFAPLSLDRFIAKNRYLLPRSVKDYGSLTEFLVTRSSQNFFGRDLLWRNGADLREALRRMALTPEQARIFLREAMRRYMLHSMISAPALFNQYRREFFSGKGLQRSFETHLLSLLGLPGLLNIHSFKSMYPEDVAPGVFEHPNQLIVNPSPRKAMAIEHRRIPPEVDGSQ